MVTRRVAVPLPKEEAKKRRLAGQLRRIRIKKCRDHQWDRIPYVGGNGHYLKCAKCGRVKKAWGLYGDGPRKRSESAEPQRDSAA